MAEYVKGVVDVLERVHPNIVVERMVSDGLLGCTLAPDWLIDTDGKLDKSAFLAEIRREFATRRSCQGQLA